MIQVNELTFSYPKSKHNVFEGLSLQLKENRIYGLLGRNGMGKSTLLYLIAGLLRPQKGSVFGRWLYRFKSLPRNVRGTVYCS